MNAAPGSHPLLRSVVFALASVLLAGGCGVSKELMAQEIEKSQTTLRQELETEKLTREKQRGELAAAQAEAAAQQQKKNEELSAALDRLSASIQEEQKKVSELDLSVATRIVDVDKSVAARTGALQDDISRQLAESSQALSANLEQLDGRLKELLADLDQTKTRLGENTRDMTLLKDEQQKVSQAMANYTNSINEMRQKLERALTRQYEALKAAQERKQRELDELQRDLQILDPKASEATPPTPPVPGK